MPERTRESIAATQRSVIVTAAVTLAVAGIAGAIGLLVSEVITNGRELAALTARVAAIEGRLRGHVEGSLVPSLRSGDSVRADGSIHR